MSVHWTSLADQVERQLDTPPENEVTPANAAGDA
jgi:hypothetical protein